MAVSAAPKAHTPLGGWHGAMPAPVLDASCEGPSAGVPDMRGLWKAFAVYVDGVARDDLAHTERIADTTVTLPLFPAMTDADVDRVCTACAEVLAAHRR